MTISLLDAVIDRQLTARGLSAPNNAATPPSTPDPYAAPTDKLITLSGYGQLLSAASRFSDTLASTASSSNTISSSSADVATGVATSGAASASYSLNVTQIAKARTVDSAAVVADPSAVLYAGGAFSIQFGSYNYGTQTFTAGPADPVSINVTNGSLNGIASAINSAGAGVTASVKQDGFGYRLSIASNQTGAASYFKISATDNDPLSSFQNSLQQLGLYESQVAQDAIYSIGGVSSTNASNTNLQLADKATFNILKAGTTTLTVSPDSSGFLGAAQALVANYNAAIGTAASLTGTGGALNGDAVGGQFATDLRAAAVATYANPGSTLTTLSSIGITPTSGSSTSTLSIDATALQTAFNSDKLGATNFLSTLAQGLKTVVTGYTNTSGGTILNQAKTVQQGVLSTILSGQPPAGVATLPKGIQELLLQRSLSTGSVVPSLPTISVFA
ncbi:flagellar filament capping protein FliD [Parachitinimonas caeni]|uniref:Flagellar hook-associated protein 2 n=1 Tax=Parachitinimonas caeni TaxID=3031301 RepID=A0ABT7DY76_9NEIS|nr:flagellar filament capping protein FliD [Parachitinimonas caeni]MDK2125013.1 flagellar filament capping protein FliD [Parachitinimonas caeni]